MISATAALDFRLLDHKHHSELVLELLVKLGQVFLGRLLRRPANDKALLVRGRGLGDNMEMDMVNFLYQHVRLPTSDRDDREDRPGERCGRYSGREVSGSTSRYVGIHLTCRML